MSKTIIYAALMGETCRAIAEDGRELARQYAKTQADAKRDIGITTDNLHPQYDQACPDGWSLEWVDDPGAHEKFIKACMCFEGNRSDQEGNFEQNEQPVEKTDPEQSGENGNVDNADDSVTEPDNPEQPAESIDNDTNEQKSESVFREVEVQVSKSEQKLRNMVRDLRNLKDEANESATEFRKQIKDAEKRLFESINGKSMTTVQCRVEYDWENDKKLFINCETDEVIDSIRIPYEERQLKMDMPGSEPQAHEPEEPDGTKEQADETERDDSGTESPQNGTNAVDSGTECLQDETMPEEKETMEATE